MADVVHQVVAAGERGAGADEAEADRGQEGGPDAGAGPEDDPEAGPGPEDGPEAVPEDGPEAGPGLDDPEPETMVLEDAPVAAPQGRPQAIRQPANLFERHVAAAQLHGHLIPPPPAPGPARLPLHSVVRQCHERHLGFMDTSMPAVTANIVGTMQMLQQHMHEAYGMPMPNVAEI